MRSKILKLIILLALGAGLFAAARYYENTYLLRSFYSVVTLLVLYLIFKFIFEEAVARQIQEPATRYSFRRALSAFFFISAVLAFITIWVEAQNLLLAYGLVGAGIAVALQDFFKNAAGGLIIFIRGNYKVGDRIEIDTRRGDVIDIDLLSTTLLEIGEWVSGDQPTGRLCMIPNGLVLSHPVHNYTKDHQFIWDEIDIPITFDSDWKLASRLVLDLVTRETEKVTLKAQTSISRLSSRYYLPERAEVPYLFFTVTDNWINFTVRYVTDVRDRRLVHDRLSRLILAEIEGVGEGKVKVSSATLNVTLAGTRETTLVNGKRE